MAKSAPKHFFSKLPSVNYPRSRFNMDFVHTTTLTTDYLYPVFCEEVLPGDTWNVGVANMIRMISPIDVPMMDNLYCDYHFWFVPSRLIWEHVLNFFGEQPREDVSTDYTVPQINFTAATLPTTGSIYDYLSIPIKGTDNLLTGAFSINALPLRAYNLIYDDWYRDEQRCDYAYYNIGDIADTPDKYFLLKRGKRFDYFTSTLLEPQIGDPVSLPLSSNIPVVTGTPHMDITQNSYPSLSFSSSTTNLSSGHYTMFLNYGSDAANIGADLRAASGNSTASLAGRGFIPNNLYADTSLASLATIADLRSAFQLQAFNELQARGGTRYVETVYTQFGVINPDILTRPEFLGGCHQALTTQPVIQNSATDSTSPQGTLTGIIYGANSEHAFTRSFTEHGFVIGIMNIYSDLTYFQGLERKWSRVTKFDYAWPVFANLTDQEVKNKEIVLTGTETDDETFGYAERYAEYKYSQNRLTGLVRPNAPLTIGQWSLAQQFGSVPVNNAEFISSDTPIERIAAVPEYANAENLHQFIANMKFSGNVVRCLPSYSDPMKWFMRG